MTVSAATSPVITTTAQAPARGGGSAEFSEEYTQFLSLLTTQVENQDPLEPLDSTAFVEQLATFSGLEQQVQTNDLLKDILRALRAEDVIG